MAFFPAALSLAAASAVVLVYLCDGLSRLTPAARNVTGERAFVLAEAGFASMETLLNAGDTGGFRIDQGDRSLRVEAEPWGSDGLDNDRDGNVDEEDEAVVRAVSTVTLGAATRTAVAWLRRMSAFLPIPSGAVVLGDPFAKVRLAGSAFSIDGRDRDDPEGHDGIDNDGDGEIDEADEHTSAPGFLPDVHSISIQGDPDHVASQLVADQLGNLNGFGGIGAATVGGFDPGDAQFIQTIVDQWSPLATIVLDPREGVYRQNLGDWNTRNFEIAKSNGDLHLGGRNAGAGILLVDGNLTITGGYSFWGYLFVTGDLVLRGPAGRKGFRGSVFVGGDLEISDDLTPSGAASFTYSSEVLGAIRAVYAERYRIAAIAESPAN